MPKRELPTAKDDGSRIFVDTSGWIALFSARDQNHWEADRAFRTLIGSKRRLLTTNLVIAEVHRLLLHRVGIQAAATALAKIESSPAVQIAFPGPDHHGMGKGWLVRLGGHAISYTDAVSFAVMEVSACGQAVSYDKHFRLAGFDLFEV